jgi:uncharacterized protein (DUF2164 family)
MVMSPVQKYQYLCGIVVIILMMYSAAMSQNRDPARLYMNDRIADIEQLYNDGKISSPDWQKFTAALFTENLDDALNQYIELYNYTSDKQLKRFIVDRVSQYYYAKGLYDSAERLLKDDSFRERIFTINIEKIYFGVQLGAFSSQDNARTAKEKYEKQVDNIIIITKNSAGKSLFVVVAGKFENRSQAEQFKNQLINNYGYKGMVIQY